jgi:hypothetical protein
LCSPLTRSSWASRTSASTWRSALPVLVARRISGQVLGRRRDHQHRRVTPADTSAPNVLTPSGGRQGAGALGADSCLTGALPAAAATRSGGLSRPLVASSTRAADRRTRSPQSTEHRRR